MCVQSHRDKYAFVVFSRSPNSTSLDVRFSNKANSYGGGQTNSKRKFGNLKSETFKTTEVSSQSLRMYFLSSLVDCLVVTQQ